jgi:hypothetical protein
LEGQRRLPARRIEKENIMGIFDKAKDMAGKAKDKVDGVVGKNSDKLPDDVEKTYDTVSDAAEPVIPGDEKPAEKSAEDVAD